jgi:tetratricopeptide (TPR) repeat protein
MMTNVMRPFLHWVLALLTSTLSGSLASAATAQAACPFDQSPGWHQATSAHFRLRTSLGAEVAQRATLELELFRAALLTAWPAEFNPEGRVEVILLPLPELAVFTRGDVRGFVMDGRDDAKILVIAQETGGVLSTVRDQPALVHELAHYLASFIFLTEPRWFAEGMASYLAMAQVSADRKESILGIPNMKYLKYVKAQGVLPMEELWRWDERPTLDDPETQASYYASSWLWVHYLLTVHRERMGRFHTAMSRAEDPRQAWEESLGKLKELEKGLQAHATARSYTAGSYPLRPVATQVEVKGVPHAEVHAVRARLHEFGLSGASEEDRRRRARLEVQQGMKEDATNVEVALEGARLLEAPQERLKLAQELIKARPEAAQAWTLLGRALRATNASRPEIEKAVRRAAELAPDSLSTQADLADSFLDAGLFEQALEPAGRAVDLAPYSATATNLYAQTRLALGYCKSGLIYLRRTIGLMRGRADAQRYLGPLSRQLTAYEAACRKARAAQAPAAR